MVGNGHQMTKLDIQWRKNCVTRVVCGTNVSIHTSNVSMIISIMKKHGAACEMNISTHLEDNLTYWLQMPDF